MRKIFAVGPAIALALVPASAVAWGEEGHQIVAFIAASELTPKARAEVGSLIGNDVDNEMAAVSTWADEIRPHNRQTAPWHYVDIPIGSAGYDAARDCPHDDCVVAQIERDEAIVGDHRFPRDTRAEALKFLIHFVGDLHQPLHVSDNHDRGGNEVHVELDGRRSNLHHIWDSDVVEALGDDPRAVASGLEAHITIADRVKWGDTPPEQWANESFRVASNEIYAKLPGGSSVDLPPTYAAAERAIVETQLEKAGVRLAAALNRAFR
jgi:nuclease S1